MIPTNDSPRFSYIERNPTRAECMRVPKRAVLELTARSR
jgi:hypothetical protein